MNTYILVDVCMCNTYVNAYLCANKGNCKTILKFVDLTFIVVVTISVPFIASLLLLTVAASIGKIACCQRKVINVNSLSDEHWENVAHTTRTSNTL